MEDLETLEDVEVGELRTALHQKVAQKCLMSPVGHHIAARGQPQQPLRPLMFLDPP
jgi:hypothetical protein